MTTPAKPRLLALSGSLRHDSYNLLLVRAMAEGAAAAGAEVAVLDWADYPLPVFNEDIERAGIPDTARAFKTRLREAEGLLIACPENNGGYPAGLKNAIDWASRSFPNDAPGSVFKNKTVVIAGATTGRWGAVRAIRQLREVLGYMGCIVLPDTLSLNDAAKAFDASGQIADEKSRQLAQATGAALARATAALKS